MELISVIVPVYNVEQYLLRCIDSILKQTYQNLEIILVDDGSPDRCPEICEEIKKKDARVKVIHKENGGLGYARNSGLDAATGQYVLFIDSDDWIREDHIEKLYSVAKRQNADAVIGGHTSVSSNGEKKIYTPAICHKVYENEEIVDKIILPLIGTETACQQDIQLNTSSCMTLYRLSVITNNHLRFLSERVAIAEDLYFNIDFFSHSKIIAVTNLAGYFYFENANSISRKYDPKRFERTLNYYITIRERISAYGLEAMVAYRAERSFLLKLRVAIRHIVFSDLQKKEKYSEMRIILKHDLVRGVLHDYPIDTFVPAMRFLAKLMRSGNVSGVYYLMKLREMGRQQKLLKAILKRMGIGKTVKRE